MCKGEGEGCICSNWPLKGPVLVFCEKGGWMRKVDLTKDLEYTLESLPF